MKGENESPSTGTSPGSNEINQYSHRNNIKDIDSDDDMMARPNDESSQSKDDTDNVRVIRSGRPRGANSSSSNFKKPNEDAKAFVPKHLAQKYYPSQSNSHDSEAKTDRCADTNSDVEYDRNRPSDEADKKHFNRVERAADNKTSRNDFKQSAENNNNIHQTSRAIPRPDRRSSNYSRDHDGGGDDDDDIDDDEDLSDTAIDDRNTEIDDDSSLPPSARGSTASGGMGERRRSIHAMNETPRRDSNTPNDAVQSNNSHRGSFAEFLKKSQSLGISIPRKSGRYDDEDDDTAAMRLSPSACEALSAVYHSPSDADLTSGGYEVNRMLGPQHSGQSQGTTANKVSFVMVAQPRGFRTPLVQCTIIRDRHSIHGKLYPTYELLLEEPKKLLITARKMNMNRTSNYHLFDMTRGQVGSKLSKKNGNYLGKLRARNSARTEYALLNKSSEKEELAGMAFDRLSLVEQLKEGNQPRKMKLVLPKLDADCVPIPHSIRDNGSGSLTDLVSDPHLYGHANASLGLHVFESKDPVYENGNYRLNFHGRVNQPSVKNFQLVRCDDVDTIFCQFGKVDDDIFHLDFKAPLNAFQAFALALCQFNL
eukprot:CAMPEP_0170096592 /NCGR_PEP_ID=MMETSP0019_2-20121128/28691_1 /TAXON_ID=98059 /ORGANISM="Dinobryon sp., Strain UTEXLB2267" /LENGTH=593 /DNA_ID=CAMNT_0010318639 /DNA_START=132 /DNA_END=1913 /DNA_ORIENTATION=+